MAKENFETQAPKAETKSDQDIINESYQGGLQEGIKKPTVTTNPTPFKWG